MKTDERYEKYNELMFMLYSMSSVDNATNRTKQRKDARTKLQLSMSALTDEVLFALAGDNELEYLYEENCHKFNVHGMEIPVFDDWLAKAISCLLPRDRDIILLYYFSGMTDEDIAGVVGMARPTVCRRRKIAKEKLRAFLEETE